MSDEYTIQISFKTPSQTLINLRGTDEQEISDQLEVLGRQLKNVGEVEAVLAAMTNLYSGLSPIEKIKADAEQAAAPPAQRPAAQQQASQAGPDGDTPMCVHGNMVARSGSKNGKAWSGHFCPTPKGTPDQCAPIFGGRR